MLFSFKNLAHHYYAFWTRIVHFKTKVQLIPIDFKKPWWMVIWKQRIYLFIILLAETVDNIFYTIMPLIIGWIVATGHLQFFFFFIAGWMAAICIEYLALYFSALLQMQSVHSLLYAAHTFFLTVDPIYHTTRSRGKIVGKIDRGVHSFEDLIDSIAFDFLPTIVGILTVIFSFLQFSLPLALLASGMIIIIGLINVAAQFLTAQAFEPQVISASDRLNSISLENLSQIQYIRSAFASNEQEQALKSYNTDMMNVGGTSIIAYSALTFITRMSYIMSILVLGAYLLSMIKSNAISSIFATALIMTYINGSYEVMRVGKKIKKFLKCLSRIADLFSFISHFGKQTFPVLQTQTPAVDIPVIKKQKDALVVDATDICFAYNQQAVIFDHHNLHLALSRSTQNKLYGIIGPSGIGKTTLISIIGGQLHPSSGSVLVQDVDIYKVDDFTRKYLVALQGQTASSLRGTIRYNLLFGLPRELLTYSDEALIAVLENVGLWQLFASKDGLNTLVGESGLNLSGGQRQRLNFANLYLRAKYYDPSLILIDEPTSSLDELSEKAITRMIDELAQNAITFVIAHRLNTLEQAVGIYDFSLVKTDKNIIFYPKEKLLSLSPYYQKLIKGEIQFD